jgi:hypothetical protein
MSLKNFLGQFHNWVTTVGVAIVIAIALYVAGDADWTVRGALVVGLGALAKWLSTSDDHKKGKKAVGEAVIKTQEILEKEGKIQGD